MPHAMLIEYLADRPEFIPRLAAWHRAEWGHLRPEETLESRDAKIESWCGRDTIPTVFVASKGGELLGSSILLAHDMETRPHWTPWLAGVVVAPEHRGRGIGALLVERSIAEARRLGFPALYLYTFTTERYYTRLGWRCLEHSTYLGGPVAVMSYALQ